MTARHHLRTWLEARRTTTPPTHDTPATEAANPRVLGSDGVEARVGVVNGVARGNPGDVDYCAGEDCLHLVEAPRQPAVEAVEGPAPHVRVFPSPQGFLAFWEVVGGDGRVRAHGTGENERDAAGKGAQILEILGAGGIDGVTLA